MHTLEMQMLLCYIKCMDICGAEATRPWTVESWYLHNTPSHSFYLIQSLFAIHRTLVVCQKPYSFNIVGFLDIPQAKNVIEREPICQNKKIQRELPNTLPQGLTVRAWGSMCKKKNACMHMKASSTSSRKVISQASFVSVEKFRLDHFLTNLLG